MLAGSLSRIYPTAVLVFWGFIRRFSSRFRELVAGVRIVLRILGVPAVIACFMFVMARFRVIRLPILFFGDFRGVVADELKVEHEVRSWV